MKNWFTKTELYKISNLGWYIIIMYNIDTKHDNNLQILKLLKWFTVICSSMENNYLPKVTKV